MGADTTSITEDFASLQDALNSGAQQRILSEYVKNPFLDDDVHALALRTGMVRQEVGPVLAELRHAGLLQSAGRRGHMLDAQAIIDASKAQPIRSLPIEKPKSRPRSFLLPCSMPCRVGWR